MRRILRGASLAALISFFACGLAPVALDAQQTDPTITVRLKKTAWTYTHPQLLGMATETIQSTKGTKKKPAVPLETVLFKDTKLTPDKVQMIFVMGSKITVLRGDDLKYLDKLVLASGPDKAGQPHHWAMTAKDEETHKLLAPHMGSRRKGKIYRIDIVPKPDAAQ